MNTRGRQHGTVLSVCAKEAEEERRNTKRIIEIIQVQDVGSFESHEAGLSDSEVGLWVQKESICGFGQQSREALRLFWIII
jgi:hypothetical protein